MKKIVTTLLGTSLLAGALFASGDHMGDHMHEGKMMNHMNQNGEVSSKMKMIDHEKMAKMHEECQAFMKSKQVDKKISNETTSQKQLKLLKELYSGDEFSG
jgi:hypothetical protein